MSEIVDLRAREVLDSRGHPTVEADALLAGGACGRAAVPSGASTGEHEAVELRDGDAERYGGRGVLRAVGHLRGEIRQALIGLDPADQAALDGRLVELDGTPDRGRLGANALLAASMAAARAAAAEAGSPLYRHLARLAGEPEPRVLPVPLLNLVNGGAHASNNLEVQEFMVVPTGPDRFREALRAGAEVFHALRRRLAAGGHSTAVGDEGGVAPDLADEEEALELLVDAIGEAGYRPGTDVALALDCAATEFHDPATGAYRLEGEAPSSGRSAAEMVELYEGWAERYPILSVEDGLAEDDWEGWRLLTTRLGPRMQLVGDDLFVTHLDRLRRGVASGVANAILVKPNQIGTVTETLAAIREARAAGYATVVSHRSGETEDTFIADLAVATGAGQIKTGSVCRSERVAKYNRLLRIEEELGDRAEYPGAGAYG